MMGFTVAEDLRRIQCDDDEVLVQPSDGCRIERTGWPSFRRMTQNHWLADRCIDKCL